MGVERLRSQVADADAQSAAVNDLRLATEQALKDEVERLRSQLAEESARNSASANYEELVKGHQEELDRLRTQLAEREAQVDSSGKDSTEAVGLVVEVLRLSNSLHSMLTTGQAAGIVEQGVDDGDVLVKLRTLRDVVNRSLTIASSEHRPFGVQLEKAHKDAEPSAEMVTPSSQIQLSAERESAALPQQPSAEAQQAVAQMMGLKAAQALKEIRLNAEEQLTWINKRMRANGPAAKFSTEF